MEFKTITNNEIENGFINKEVIDFENRIVTNKMTDSDKKELIKEWSELGEEFFK